MLANNKPSAFHKHMFVDIVADVDTNESSKPLHKILENGS